MKKTTFLLLTIFLFSFSSSVLSEVKVIEVFSGQEKLLDLNIDANLIRLKPGNLRSTNHDITLIDPLLFEGSKLVLFYTMYNLTDYYDIEVGGNTSFPSEIETIEDNGAKVYKRTITLPPHIENFSITIKPKKREFYPWISINSGSVLYAIRLYISDGPLVDRFYREVVPYARGLYEDIFLDVIAVENIKEIEELFSDLAKYSSQTNYTLEREKIEAVITRMKEEINLNSQFSSIFSPWVQLLEKILISSKNSSINISKLKENMAEIESNLLQTKNDISQLKTQIEARLAEKTDKGIILSKDLYKIYNALTFFDTSKEIIKFSHTKAMYEETMNGVKKQLQTLNLTPDEIASKDITTILKDKQLTLTARKYFTAIKTLAHMNIPKIYVLLAGVLFENVNDNAEAQQAKMTNYFKLKGLDPELVIVYQSYFFKYIESVGKTKHLD